jgi:hypothetical protein
MSYRRWAVRLAPAIVVVVLLLRPAGAGAQSVYCTCNERYFAFPAECTAPGACRLKITCNGCMVTGKKCAVLAHNTFKRLYNQAVFVVAVIGGEPAQKALANGIVDAFFAPLKHTDFAATLIQRVTGPDEWAHIQPPASGDQPTLVVAPDASRKLSPPGLVSALGHEMVHVEQLKRPKRTNVAYIFKAVTALRELEATSWELNQGGLNPSFGASRVYACLPAVEKDVLPLVKRCREWQVKKSIEDIRTSPRGAQSTKELEKWFNEDPWVKAAWLPRHATWKTDPAGAKPDDQCPNP